MKQPRAISQALRSGPLSPTPLIAVHPQTVADRQCLVAYQREVDYIYRTLLRLGVDWADLGDLAQELFLALRHSWPDYDSTRPLRPYLFGIAFRIVAAHRRKRRRELMYGLLEVEDLGASPVEALDAKEARTLLLKALERIPLPRRAVLVMHELDDVSVADIARVLSIPLFTVYSRLRKGRRELRAAVQRLDRAR